MANPYDQFDQTKREGNLYDQFDPSILDSAIEGIGEIPRQLGLTARHAAAGPAKALTGVNDAFLQAANQLAKYMGMEGEGAAMTTPMVDRVLDEAGLPKTENSTERVVQMASEFLSGAAPMIQAGKAAPLMAPLSQAPAAQAVGSTVGGGASQLAGEMGAPPLVQQGIGLAAGIVPQWLGAGAQAAARVAGRGTNPAQMQQNMQAFENVGTPTAGQATQTPSIQSLENRIAGQPAMTQRIQSQKQGAEQMIMPERIQPTPTQAGKLIESGIKGEGGFVDTFKANAKTLYDDVDQFIDPKLPMEMRNTFDFFGSPPALNAAPRTAKKLASSYLTELGVSLKDDVIGYLDNTGDIGLPYATVKEIRSAVGKRLSGSNLIDDVSKGELKQLYGALSRDLEDAAFTFGGETGRRAAQRANTYYKAGNDRIERVQKVVNKAGGPEKIYRAATAGTNEGSTVLRGVMRSIDPQDRSEVAHTILRRMASPSKFDAAIKGKTDLSGFDFDTFSNNWNKMSPEARNEIGRAIGTGGENAIDAINRASTLVNSGTTKNTAMPAIMNALTNYNVFAKLVTNPKAIDFLLNSTKVPASQGPIILNEFLQILGEE